MVFSSAVSAGGSSDTVSSTDVSVVGVIGSVIIGSGAAAGDSATGGADSVPADGVGGVAGVSGAAGVLSAPSGGETGVVIGIVEGSKQKYKNTLQDECEV